MYKISIIVITLVLFNFGTFALAGSDLQSGSLVKAESSPAVYQVGDNYNLWLFPSESIFYSWYDSFDGLVTVSDQVLAEYAVEGNKEYNSDKILVKSVDAPEVYSFNDQGQLRYVPSLATAVALYGGDWEQMISVVSENQFNSYEIGPEHVDIGVMRYSNESEYTRVQLHNTIYGRVTDAETGEPIYGKTIAVAYSSYSATTNHSGEYAINLKGAAKEEYQVYSPGNTEYMQSEIVTVSLGEEILFEITKK